MNEQGGRTGGELDALRRRDQQAFAEMLDRHYPVTFQLAALLDPGAARERARAAWLELISSADVQFAPSVRTWLLRRVAAGEGSSAGTKSRRGDASAFEDEDSLWVGHWRDTVEPWPSDRPAGDDALGVALAALPPLVGLVVLLRDIHGLCSDEVAAVCGLDDAGQRVLLHDGRLAVRDTLAAETAT